MGLALLASACGGGGGGSSSGSSGNVPGSVVLNSETGLYFVVEGHSNGEASALRVVETFWGRLVDVYDVDSASPVMNDFVIGADIDSNGVDFLLERDPLTEREQLRILYQLGTPEFNGALAQAEANLQVVLKKGLATSELPPFTAVPRNAAMVVRFNDLLDDGGSPLGQEYPGRVNPTTVRVLTGYPPTTNFEARILPDPNHGDTFGGVFHSTRIIVDLPVSEDDARVTNLPVNALGLPEALNATQPNGVIRFPTKTSPNQQQFEVLTNLSGRSVSFTGNGPTDSASATLDVLRSFRSGGKTSITGDANNGFLIDNAAPVIVGTQIVTVIQTGPLGGSDGKEFDLTFQFQTSACAVKPVIGDVLDFPNHRVRIIQDYLPLPVAGIVGPVRARLLCDPTDLDCQNPTTPPPATAGTFQTTYKGSAQNPSPDFGACFVRISPTPTSLPATGVPVNATFTVTFSEPIDPSSVSAFDTFTLSHSNNSPSATNNLLYKAVVARVVPSQDLRSFTFQPIVPLRKVAPGGQADLYTLDVLGGVGGVTDLAGNTLSFGIASTPVRLTTVGAAVDSGSVSLKFNSGDEDGDGNPELRGQFLFDTVRRSIKPRAVSRFSQVCDPSVPIVGAMIQFTQPIQTPLSNWGSRTMTVWRYCDLGMGLRDDSTHNIDVEGMWWTPFTQNLQVDSFAEFQMNLAHSKYLPDEELSTALLPNWPTSGVISSFEGNLLDKNSDPLTVVHQRARGYSLEPTDVDTTSTNNVIAPWPMNRNVPESEFVYWTWRDTGKIAVGAPNGAGADVKRLIQITKTGLTKFYPVNQVPTIGLPLLMEFRTYIDSKASGQNGFRVSLALNSSARPYFRVFSTGGINPQNPQQIKQVNPDTEVNGTGAYNQTPPYIPVLTQPLDNVIYHGQADFLIRISRLHTIWFDTLATGTLYAEPVVEPSSDLLPNGTQVLVAYRGATQFTLNGPPAGVIPYADASLMDSYGDGFSQSQLSALTLPVTLAFTPQFFNVPNNTTDKSWKTTISSINSARYFQARVSFLANPQTALVPEVSSLGFSFRR